MVKVKDEDVADESLPMDKSPILNMIHMIRGQQVMIDKDLAMLSGIIVPPIT